MTAQSRYVNKKKLKGSILIPFCFLLISLAFEIKFLSFAQTLFGFSLAVMVALQTCVCSTKHFKHVNRRWKIEILRKSLTVTAHYKTKRGRVKYNRYSKGLILLIVAWHLFSAAEICNAFIVDNDVVSCRCALSHLFSRGICNYYLMFMHLSEPWISWLAHTWCHINNWNQVAGLSAQDIS